MDIFERTAWADAHYAAIGRALTFSTRFEANCKVLNILLGVKNTLGSEEDIKDFVERTNRLMLNKHISSIVGNNNELKDILDKARLARNEIAHELTLGLYHFIDTLPESHIQEIIESLKELIKSIAEADRIISLILSIETNEQIPSPKFLKEYPNRIERWVTDIGEII